MYSQRMIIFMGVFLVLLLAYFRWHPTSKETPELFLHLLPKESSGLMLEEIKRINTGFKTPAEILSGQQLKTSASFYEVPVTTLNIASSEPQFDLPQIETNSPPVSKVKSPQSWQQRDAIKRQQEDLRRQQEMLKQQLKNP